MTYCRDRNEAAVVLQCGFMNQSDELNDNRPVEPGGPDRATWIDLVGFLIGRRQSIQRLIDAKHGLWLGGVLVFSAALAREYDAVSLLHRPWELLGSFAASLLLCSGLFLWVQFCLFLRRRPSEAAGNAYASFLTGYWLTAPLAWIYAIPIETMSDEVFALKFNLTALSIVSLWRVALFARVVSVQFRLPYWVSLSWILLPCMVVALGALLKAVVPMIAIMGGLRLTQTQEILRDFQSNLLGLLFYALLPVFLVWCSTLVWFRDASTSVPRHDRTTCRSKGLWAVAMAAVLALMIAGVRFQPDLWRSAKVDRLLRRGDFQSAIDFMSAQGEDQFPVNWDPPPRFPAGDARHPEVVELAEALRDAQPSRWIIDRLLAQADEILMRQFGWGQGTRDLTYVSNQISYLDLETLERLDAAMTTMVDLGVGDDASERRHYAELQRAIEQGIEDHHHRLGYEQELATGLVEGAQ